MTATATGVVYIDTSAFLRVVLREAGALPDLRDFERWVSSELLVVESLRTVDRLRVQGALDVTAATTVRADIAEWVEAVDLVRLRAPILSRASDPMPVGLGTLDAIHLASALAWRDRSGAALTVATHDAALALAARSFGLVVVGA